MAEYQEVPKVDEPAHTPEESQAAAEIARTLMSKNVHVSGAAQAMLLCRRAYGAAVNALERAVAKETDNKVVVDAVAAAMQDYSRQPFDLEKTIEQISSLLVPLLLAENALQDQQEAESRVKAVKNADAVRREMPVDLGFEWEPNSTYLPRGETLILYGHQDALSLVIRNTVEKYKDGGKVNVLHLMDKYHEDLCITNRRDKSYVAVGINQWRHQAQSRNKLGQFIAGWVRYAQGVKFDLIVVDDMTQLVKPAILGSDPIRSAPETLKMLRKVADEFGAGLVCSIPMTTEAGVPAYPDADSRIYDTLGEYATLKPVLLLGALGTTHDTHYRLMVGDDGKPTEIPRELITVEKEEVVE